tara:strand:+ start:1625 stop:2305 length:681 start_codon:yes stop_codon:yes gene_type:complete
MNCVICGSKEFQSIDVLWPELIQAWKLSDAEVGYINRQQGTCCVSCGNNLRGQALASGIMSVFGRERLFKSFVRKWASHRLKVLSINTCGTLHSHLSRLKNHKLAEYPEYDMKAFSFKDSTFDLVLHSDSLEHIDDPLQALSECHRILKPGGYCIYTIPIVVGRMSETTVGKPPSYHGDPKQMDYDWMVQTEYGCDAWLQPLKVGFQSCTMHAYEVPSAFALICKK